MFIDISVDIFLTTRDASRLLSKYPISCRRTASRYLMRIRDACLSAVCPQQNPSVKFQNMLLKQMKMIRGCLGLVILKLFI